MNDAQKFLEAVEHFGHELEEAHPELSDIITKTREGTLSVQDAVKRVWALAAKNAEIRGTLENAMFAAFRVEVDTTDLAHFPDREQLLEKWGFEEEDLIFRPFEDRPEYTMLHPLLMGMIVEVLQFDGDVPELRTGRLPEGGSPAVPVKTSARDPVVIGAMLRTASQEVAAELALAQAKQDENVGRMIESFKDSPTFTGIARREIEKGVAVPGYEPGKKAAARAVNALSTETRLRMGFEERQELAHKALTSTQGRRSAAPAIEQMILDGLHAEGITSLRLGAGTEIYAEAEWDISIDGGRRERNPNFNFIEVAARSLTAKLKRELIGRVSRFTHLFLQVSPINEISERRVGWRAVVLE